MSTKEKTIIIVSSIFVGGLVLIGLAVAMYNVGVDSHTGADFDTKTLVEAVEPKKDTEVSLKSDDYDDYISGAKKIFVDSCVGSDQDTESYCGCAYDWLNDNLTNAEFFDVTGETLNGKIPDEMYEAAKACT